MKNRILSFKDVSWACFEFEGKTMVQPYFLSKGKSIVLLPSFKKCDYFTDTDAEYFLNNSNFEFVRVFSSKDAFKMVIENSFFDELPKSWRAEISKTDQNEHYFTDEQIKKIVNLPIENARQINLFIEKMKNAYQKTIDYDKKKIEEAERIRRAEEKAFRMEKMLHPTESSIDIYKRIHGIKTTPTTRVFHKSSDPEVVKAGQERLKELYKKYFDRDFDTDYYTK